VKIKLQKNLIMTGKNKKQNTTQAIVVYSKPAQKQNKKKKKSSGSNGADPVSVYKKALSMPFDPQSLGARVPDMYACPTVTRHITRTVTLTTNAGGEADLIILPSAYQNAVSPRGSISGGSTWTLMDGNTYTNSVIYTSATTLSTAITNYRIVGYGIKVMGTSSMTTSQGRLVIATAAVSTNVNDKLATVGGQATNSNNAGASMGNTIQQYGFPTSASGTVDITQLPMAQSSVEISMVNACEKPVFVTPKITSPEAFVFKNTKDSSLGFGVTDQTSVSFVSSGDPSYLRVAGFESVAVTVTGGPVSTSVVDVEIIYHLEGLPSYQSSSGIGIAGDAAAVSVNPLGFLNAVQTVAKMPAFRAGVETLGNSFFPGLGSLANRLF